MARLLGWPPWPPWPLIALLLAAALVGRPATGLQLESTPATTSELSLEGAHLTQLPRAGLCHHNSSRLNLLSLADNQIGEIEEEAFSCVGSALRILILSYNRIQLIEEGAFRGLEALQVLRLDHNRIPLVPNAATLQPLASLRHLNLAHNRIMALQAGGFLEAQLSRLLSLDLSGNPLTGLPAGSFAGLGQVQTLSLAQLSPRPSLAANLAAGLAELRFLHLDGLQLELLPADLCLHAPKLSSLWLKSNQLAQLPQFAPTCSSLLLLDLSHNRLAGELADSSLSALAQLPSLLELQLSHNQLAGLQQRSLAGLNQLQSLRLSHNQLLQIHPRAFEPLARTLTHLDLASNPRLELLPGAGLERLRSFVCTGNQRLRQLPRLPSAQHLRLTFAYHCCDYPELSRRPRPPPEPAAGHAHSDWARPEWLSERTLWPGPQQPNQSARPLQIGPAGPLEHTFLELWPSTGASPGQARCLPAPSAFLPCQDLFEDWWLRLAIWLVALAAFLGNLLVILVLGTSRASSSSSALSGLMWMSRRRIDVPRFLVLNLAIADLMMALYLAILALVDLSTLGQFRLHAIRWQHSVACQLAGFLGVLSSELSVFILAIITLERGYAITNAVHLNRRLSLHKAALIMFLGYALALALALLPLHGYWGADYRAYSICLPLDSELAGPFGQQQPPSARLYLASLLTLNTFSFGLLLSCYMRMYCAIRGSQAWNANDLRIAKRMSILVITDFLCWAPLLCVGSAALFGYQLVSQRHLKLLTVFVLPLNSLANPFLYAITTNKFRRDLHILGRRIKRKLRFNRRPHSPNDQKQWHHRPRPSQVDRKLDPAYTGRLGRANLRLAAEVHWAGSHKRSLNPHQTLVGLTCSCGRPINSRLLLKGTASQAEEPVGMRQQLAHQLHQPRPSSSSATSGSPDPSRPHLEASLDPLDPMEVPNGAQLGSGSLNCAQSHNIQSNLGLHQLPVRETPEQPVHNPDSAPRQQQRPASRALSWLQVLEPLVQHAWSSVQISLVSPQMAEQPQHQEERSVSAEPWACSDNMRNPQETPKPSAKARWAPESGAGKRRMSRSLELASPNQLDYSLNGAGSQTKVDLELVSGSRRLLLASKGPFACSRCRSWSPAALLGRKLERCISQRSKKTMKQSTNRDSVIKSTLESARSEFNQMDESNSLRTVDRSSVRTHSRNSGLLIDQEQELLVKLATSAEQLNPLIESQQAFSQAISKEDSFDEKGLLDWTNWCNQQQQQQQQSSKPISQRHSGSDNRRKQASSTRRTRKALSRRESSANSDTVATLLTNISLDSSHNSIPPLVAANQISFSRDHGEMQQCSIESPETQTNSNNPTQPHL